MKRVHALVSLVLTIAAVPAGAYYPQWTKKNSVPMSAVTIAAVDFNGDGRPDVVTRTPGHSVYVSFSAADGTLSDPAVPVHDGSYLSDLAVGDADGNGTNDVIVSNTAANTIAVLPGNGDGTFGTPIVTSLPFSPTRIATADFNGDGELDVAYHSYSAAEVGVLAGDGAGHFSEIASWEAGEKGSLLETGDVDHDGHADLALAYSDTKFLTLYCGNGDGTFDPAVLLPSPGASPSRMVLADLDADEDLEILFCHFAANTLTVVLNNGSRTFAGATVYSTLRAGPNPFGDPLDLAVGEVDGEEGVDVVVTLANDRSLATFPGNGNGTLSAPRYDEAGTFGSGSDFPNYLALGEFTGDGRLDVALAGSRSLGVYVNYAGDSRVTLTTAYPTITTGQAARFDAQVDLATQDSYLYGDPPQRQGTITLRSGGTDIGSGTLTGGRVSIEVTSLPIGTHTVTAEYSGDDEYRSSASAAVTQNVVGESTTTTLTSSAPGGIAYGAGGSVTAEVTSPLAGPLDGDLFLYRDGVRVNQYAQNGPTSSWTLQGLEPGSYEFYATFGGTDTQPPSTSNVITQVVTKAPTTMLIENNTPVRYSQQNGGLRVTLSSPSNSWIAGQQVKLYEGNVLIQTVDTDAYLNLGLPPGIHHLRAVFEGSSRYEASQSEFFEYTVVPDDPLTLVAASNGTTINIRLFDTSTAGSYYRFYRRIGTAPWELWSQTIFKDRVETNVQAGVAHLYRADKYSGGINDQLLATSNVDVAMVGTFSDHPVLAGMPAKAVHVTELVSAANVLRAASGAAPLVLNGAVSGGAIRAEHVLLLRDAINQARTGVGMPAVSWADPIAPGGPVRALHIMEMRHALR